MPRLIWTPAALADVHRLYRFLDTTDSQAAKRAIQAIRSGVKILAHQPRIGRRVENLESEFREWRIQFGNSGYVVLYRADDLTIAVLAIRHQREVGY